MTTRKKQTVILITATTLGMTNISNSYVFAQAQDIPIATNPQAGISDKIYDEHGNLLINELTFPDAYFREYVNRELAKGAGFFTQEELLNITTIMPTDTRGQKLSNLSSVAGIEYFPNLRVLKLNSTGLTTLDVSKNTLLTELDVSKTPLKVLELKDNKNITRLETLDTNLIYFNVNSEMRANVAIQTVSNISIPSNATEIDLNELFPGIDYSKIKKVWAGQLNNGILSNYRFDYAVEITYPLVYKDFLGGTQKREFKVYLTVVYELPITDVYFPDKAFQEYLLNNKDINKNGSLSTYEINALNDIDISNHKDIKSLQGIEYLSRLLTLNCSNTNIRSLDLSKITNLRDLNTTNMPLGSIQIQTSHPHFYWAKNTSPIILDTKETYIDLAKEFPGIDISKIDKNKIKNGRLEGTLLHFQDTDQPMEYTYDAGSAYGNAQTLSVSIMMNKEEYLKIDDTNFLDKAFQEYLLATHDSDGNGSFSQVELINIKEIDIADNKQIHNLKGIEHFESLNSLNCSNTDIGYLDLSNNKGLQNLNTTNTPLAWININPADPNFSWTKNKVSFIYDSNDKFIDLEQSYPGIDLTRINKNSIKNGYLTGSILYVQDPYQPLEYTYNAGTVNGKSFILNVSVNMKYLKIDDSNFPDQEFQQYVRQFDKDHNGYFSQSELDAVTEIDVRGNKNIKNLKGLEHFQNLTHLDCSNTSVAELDVNNNKKLTYLYCHTTQLKTLNVKENEKLQRLSCANTSISELDVSNNKELEYLYCYNTQLKTLNVNENEKLLLLDCSNINISELDVSKNKELVNLYCQHTQLNTLNVNENEKLRLLNCNKTSISELDVSNNMELVYLLCWDTQLKTLNVNENEKLELLLCYGIKTLDTLNLQNNVNLTHLDCHNTAISDLDLTNNEKITYLNISETKIKDLDLSNQKLLQSLYIYNNDIDTLNVTHLKNLKDLDITSTNITELDLTYSTNLEYLNCYYTPLTGLDLSNNKKLNKLHTELTPLTWIYFGTDNTNSLQWEKDSPTIQVDVTKPYIDLLDYPGIDINKIKQDSVTGGTLIGNYLYYDKSGEMISYMYDAGTVGGVAQELEVQFIPNEVGVKVDAANFPDPKFLAYVEKNIDNDDTGVLSPDEIDAVLSIDLSNSDYNGITSINGIEYFPSLTSLNLSGTKIPSLNLQKNTNLKDLQIDGMGLSHLYLGDNGDIKVNGGQSSATSVLQVTVDGSSFDITKVFPGIEIDRIHNLTSADLIGTTVQGYLPNTPITYSYKANDNENNPITLYVTLQLNVIKQDRTISFRKDFNKDYDGTQVTISSNDIDMLGDKSLLSYTWQELENNTWVDMNEAPVHAGVYRVIAHAEADDFYKEASSQPKEVIISQAQNEWTVTPSITEWTYGQYDANKNALNAAAKFGQYYVTYKDAQGYIVTTTPQDAGAWTMVVSVPETEDYRGISKEVPFTIHKAPAPALVLPENLSAVHGDVLSSIVLPKGWTWVNGQETISIRKLSYTARFTVDDKNYDYTTVPGYHANGGYVEHEIVLSISKATNTWTEAPSIDNWTYGETAIEPTGQAAYGNVEVSYSNAKDGTFTKDVPTEAGNWFVKLKVPTSTEYTGLEEILSFTIHKAPAPALVLPENLNTVHGDELSTITLPKGWTWIDEKEKVSVHKTSYAARFTVDDKNYDYSNVAGYNATGHYVEIQLSVTVSEHMNQWDELPSIKNWTYGEQPVHPTGKAAHGDVEVSYSDSVNGTFTKDVPTEAGNWFVKLQVPASAEYTGLEEILPFTIHKAPAPALVLPENLSAVHGDILSNIVLPNGWTWVDEKEKVSVHKTSYTARFTVDDKNYNYSNVAGYNATEHYVEIQLSVTISEYLNQWIEMPSIESWTYGEQPVQPTGKAAHGDVEVSYSNAKDGTFTKNVPTEAGNWFVKLHVPASTEYTGLEEILPFTIHKAPAPALVLPENLSAVHGNTLSSIVLPNGWTWVNGKEKVSVHKTGYAARFAIIDDKNYDYSKVTGYDANGHYVERELSVVVSKINNIWTETPSMNDWTYGETAIEPKGKAAHGDVEVTYSNAKDGTFTKDIPTEAGNWFVKLHVPASAEYTGLEEILPFTIKQAVAPALTLPENLSAVHGDILSNIVLPTEWTWVDGQEKVSVHKTSYAARFTVDDKNYDYSTVAGYDANGHYVEIQLSVTVSEYLNHWIEMSGIESWTYGEQPVQPTGKAAHGDVEVSYSDSVNGTFTKDVPTEAGNWFVKLQVSASAEYTGLEEILPFTIHKATAPALVLPENLSAVHGDSLSNIVLPTGWTWVDEKEKVSVHKTGYAARFTVDDKNYDYTNVAGYNAIGHYVEIQLSVTISEYLNQWIEMPSIESWTYGEQPVQPAGKAAHGDVEVSYSDSVNGTFTKDVPTEAGDWFVKVQVSASAEYTGLEVILPFTIHKAPAPALVFPENLSALHGDALSSIKLPNGWYWVDTQGSVAGNVRTYLARCIVDDKNYDYSTVAGYNASGHYVEVELTILIAQQSNQWIEKPSIEDWMEGKTPAQPSGKAEHGDVVFTYSNAIDGTYVSEQPTKPGTWYMKASVSASEAYLGLEEIVTFKILPKEDIVKDTDVAQASGLWTIVLASIIGLLSCFTRKKQRNKK